MSLEFDKTLISDQVDSSHNRGIRGSLGNLSVPARQRRGRKLGHRPGPLGTALRLLQEPRRRRQTASRPTRGHQPARQVWQLPVAQGVQLWPSQVSIGFTIPVDYVQRNRMEL